jgi:hypothetical protein
MCFDFPYNFEIFLILRTTMRDTALNIHTKLQENPSVGAELFHAGGKTDTPDQTNSRSSQFCERA